MLKVFSLFQKILDFLGVGEKIEKIHTHKK
jgi:hypothetical protein